MAPGPLWRHLEDPPCLQLPVLHVASGPPRRPSPCRLPSHSRDALLNFQRQAQGKRCHEASLTASSSLQVTCVEPSPGNTALATLFRQAGSCVGRRSLRDIYHLAPSFQRGTTRETAPVNSRGMNIYLGKNNNSILYAELALIKATLISYRGYQDRAARMAGPDVPGRRAGPVEPDEMHSGILEVGKMTQEKPTQSCTGLEPCAVPQSVQVIPTAPGTLCQFFQRKQPSFLKAYTEMRVTWRQEWKWKQTRNPGSQTGCSESRLDQLSWEHFTKRRPLCTTFELNRGEMMDMLTGFITSHCIHKS